MFGKFQKKLCFYCRLYKKIISAYLRIRLGYRLDFLVGFFGMLIKSVSGIITLSIIFSNVPQIEGWSYYHLLFMYGLSSLVLIPVETFFANAWGLHNHIIQGTFVKYCLKPINTMFFYFSEVVEIKSLLQLFISVPILIISGRKMDINWSFPLIGAYILYFICGSIILISIYVMAASLGFWLMNSMSIINFVSQVMNFSKYPISIYGPFLKTVFTYILPIGFVSYYPMMLMLGKISYVNLIQAIVTTILFGALGCFIWHKGVEHYSGTGS